LYPNLNPAFLNTINFTNIRALIVEAFGSGNFPIRGDQNLLPFFKKITEQDILLIITSQAPYDSVNLSNYKSGRKALELGALSAADMTTEATLTKIMYLLAQYPDNQDVIKLFNRSVAGEMNK
jgi:L-asparaginase